MQIANVFLFLVLILGIGQTPFLPSLQTGSSLTHTQTQLGIAFADSDDEQDSLDINAEVNATVSSDDAEDNSDDNSNDNSDDVGDDVGDDINATDNNADDMDNNENDADNGDVNNEDAGDQNDDDSDHMAGNETQAEQNAQEKFSELQQRIDELEQRLQSLLAMFESGSYFGTTFGAEQTISYDLSFDGTATSIDGSTQDNMTGEIFFESLVTRDDVSKFRVTGGVVSIGSNDYDIIFGKARVTTSDEADSMVLIAQTVDDQGNAHTLKILLDSVPFSALDQTPSAVNLKTQSKIAGQWTLSATGQLSVI